MKRGLSDTSKPGAFCKDQATFDGSMRILEHRASIHFPALYAGKVSLETYNLCEEALKESAASACYTCPPQIRGAENAAFFKRRIDAIYQSHQVIFQKAAKAAKTCCSNPIRPPLTFFGEKLPLDFLIESNRLLQSC